VEEGDADVCAEDLVGELGDWRDRTGVKHRIQWRSYRSVGVNAF
jgi:hypothetical protein